MTIAGRAWKRKVNFWEKTIAAKVFGHLHFIIYLLCVCINYAYYLFLSVGPLQQHIFSTFKLPFKCKDSKNKTKTDLI